MCFHIGLWFAQGDIQFVLGRQAADKLDPHKQEQEVDNMGDTDLR